MKHTRNMQLHSDPSFPSYKKRRGTENDPPAFQQIGPFFLKSQHNL